MTTRTAARVDRLVAEVLGGFSSEADVTLRMPMMEAPIDAIWTDALLSELVAGRLAEGAESLGVSVRLGADAVQLTVWDDGRPMAHSESVRLIAAKLRARVSDQQRHEGRTAVRVEIPF